VTENGSFLIVFNKESKFKLCVPKLKHLNYLFIISYNQLIYWRIFIDTILIYDFIKTFSGITKKLSVLPNINNKYFIFYLPKKCYC